MRKYAGILAFFILFFTAQAQERVLGTWKMFFSYNNSQGVCNAGDKVFSATNKALFSYEKSTGVIRTYDKSSGLSDVGIGSIAYDNSTHTLVIAYSNSNIDLLVNENEVYNIRDIKNAISSGAININSLYATNGKCYVSSDLGISEINLTRHEISNTYVIGNSGGQVKIYATATDANFIYAATQEGVKYAPINSPNLQNFNSWTLFDTTEGLPAKKATQVAALNGRVFVVMDAATDTLFERNGNTWSRVFADSLGVISSLQVVNGNIYFTVYSDNGPQPAKNGKIDAAGVLTATPCQGHGRPVGWFEADGWAWEADNYNGLYRNNQNGYYERIVPSGPAYSDAFDIEVADGKVYVAGGGTTDSWDLMNIRSGFGIYNGADWDWHNQYSDGQLSDYSDILSTAPVPALGKAYFGSFLSGVVQYDLNSHSITTYDQHSAGTTLEPTQGDPARTKISCMTTDIYNNVWLCNAGGIRMLKLIKPDGTWKDFQVPYSFSIMKKIVFDDYGQLWAPTRGNGLYVWSYNNTIDDESDDASRWLHPGSGQGGLPDDQVFCVAKDLDGNMWVGTYQGIGVFYCPGSVLTQGGCDADKIKVVNPDGYVGYLFATENVRAIAVDAANRKWVGTTNGLWLISADGKDQLLKFTVDNSPLPANQVTDIAIDPATGEVFVATTGGMVSYQGDAISDCTDCEDKALVYPNPVKPDYEGPIAIKGLTDRAYVKITDIAGNLIYQGKANGCQMIWDGKNYKGERAKSGVYLVFSSTDLGKEKKVAKILIAN